MSLPVLFLVVAASQALTGCVVGTRSIDLNAPVIESRGADKGQYRIEYVNDKRVFEQSPRKPSTPSIQGDLSQASAESLSNYIGRQRNGYGKAMGVVRLPEGGTIQQEMQDVLEAGFAARGYQLSDDENAPLTVRVDVTRFWAWFSPGFIGVRFFGNVETELTLDSAGQQVSVTVEGEGRNLGQVASNANWALAYDRAFLNYLENLDKTLDENGL